MKKFFCLLNSGTEAVNSHGKKSPEIENDLRLKRLLRTFISDIPYEKAVMRRLLEINTSQNSIDFRKDIVADLINNDELFSYFYQMREALDDIFRISTVKEYVENSLYYDYKVFLTTEKFCNEFMKFSEKAKNFLNSGFSVATNEVLGLLSSVEFTRCLNDELEKISPIRKILDETMSFCIDRRVSKGIFASSSLRFDDSTPITDILIDLCGELGVEIEKNVGKTFNRNEFLPNEFFEVYQRLNSDVFIEIRKFAETESLFVEKEIFNLIEEINSVLGFATFFRNLNMPFCKGKKGDNINIKNLFSPWLLLDGKTKEEIVLNDYSDENGKFCIVTGANGGGKTIFLSSVALNQIFYQACGICFAENAVIKPLPGIFTHFPAEEKNDSTGRLGEEMKRTEEILMSAEEDSAIFLNETFTGTKGERAVELSREMLKKINQKNLRGLFVTHFHELYEDMEKVDTFGVLNTAVIEENGKRLFKIIPKKASANSFSHDILYIHKMTADQLQKRVIERRKADG